MHITLTITIVTHFHDLFILIVFVVANTDVNVDQSQHVKRHVPVDISDPAFIAKITEFHAELALFNMS